MNREDFEKAKNIENEIENIKEVINILEYKLGVKIMCGLFDVYTKEKVLSGEIRMIMKEALQKRVDELNKEIDNI